ncbi:MAG: autotransporter-associated beta strand repeat-containing protein, partial [Tepidisphaeraceae bacterium]
GKSNLNISDPAAGAVTCSQAISGNGSLTVNVPNGSLVLSGANTYSGPTHVMAGTLTLTPQFGLNQYWYAGSNLNQTSGWNSMGVAPGAMAGLYARGNNSGTGAGDAPYWGQGTSWQGSWDRTVLQYNDATWTYTGYVYAATNTISLMGICDDYMSVKLNGNWIANAATGDPYVTYATGVVNVSPGWVPVQISFFSTNLAGAGGYNSQGPYQIGCDPDGGLGAAAPAGSDFQVNSPGISGSVATAASVIGINPGSGIAFPAGTNQSATMLFQSGPSSSLPANTALLLDAGTTLNLNNACASIGSLTGAGNVNGGGVLTVGGDNTSTVFSGQISSALNLIKNGAGTLSLTGQNTFTGATTITSGAINVGNSNALQFSAVAVDAANGLAFSVPAATLGGLSGSGAMTLANGAAPVALTINNAAASAVYSGAITDGGAGSSITVNNGGLFALSARNSYSGATSINGGVFQANDGGGLPANSALTLNGAILQSDGPALFTRALNSGNFTFTGNSGFAATGGHFTGNLGGNNAQLTWATDPIVFGSPSANNVVELTNAIDLAGQTATVQVASGLGGDSALLSGNITDSHNANAGINKTGPGLLTLSGNNNFGGGVTITAGTVQMGSPTALGVAVTPTVAFSETNPATLQLNGYSLSPNLPASPSNWANAAIENGNANPNPVTLTLGDITYAGTIRDGANAGPLSINKPGPNVLTLMGANAWSGTMTIPAGAVVGNSFSLTGPIVMSNNTSVTFNQQAAGIYSQTISGAGSLIVTGSAIVRMTQPQTYTGNTCISGGTLA